MNKSKHNEKYLRLRKKERETRSRLDGLRQDAPSYFSNIMTNGIALAELQIFWPQINNGKFSPSALISTVRTIMRKITDLPKKDRPAVEHYIRENVGLYYQAFFENRFEASPADMVDFLITAETMGETPSNAMQIRWCKEIENKIGSLESRHLPHVMRFLTKFFEPPPLSLLKSLDQLCTEKMNEFPPGVLFSLMLSYAKLDTRPSENFTAAWENEFLKQAKNLDSQNMRAALWSHAYLGLLPSSDVLETINRALQEKDFYFSESTGTDILWALAVFSARSLDPVISDMAEVFFQKIEAIPHRLSNVSQSKVNLAAIRFDRPELHDYALTQETTSRAEKKLSLAFKRSNLRLCDAAVPELFRKVDICVKYDRHKVRIEVDGKSHYVQDLDGDIYTNGATKLQNALIVQLYPKDVLIRLDYITSEDITWRKGDYGLMCELKHAFRESAAGVYETVLNDQRNLELIPIIKTIDAPACP